MIGFNDRGIITIIGPGLIEIFGLEMATELAPYKGFSMFMAYMTVPLYQIIFSHFLNYRGILVVFIVFTIAAVYLSHHFNSKMPYTPFGQKKDEAMESQGNNDTVENEKYVTEAGK